MTADARAFLTGLFHAAVRAADPREVLRGQLPELPKGRTVVVGAGKGAAQMARAFEDLWPAPCEGVVVTRYGYACPTRHIRVIEAAHPVPDAAGLQGARALMEAVRGLGPDDLVVASLRGLELGEAVCIPSLPDVADWNALEAAEAKIAPNASRDTVADRYRN